MSVSAARKLELFAEFKALVEARGGTVLEAAWFGNNKPYHVRCAAGHDCYPRSSDVQQGGGFCRQCYLTNRAPDPRSALAWAAFNDTVEAQGGAVLETEWLGADTPHHAICAEGHDCWPVPSSVKGGQGICGPCGIIKRTTTIKARTWARFKSHVEALGGTVLVLETEWLGIAAKYHVLCDQGHDCWPIPNNVEQYDSLSCEVCAGRDAATQWAAFRNAVEAQGGGVLEAEWLGSAAKHHIRCTQGHDCWVLPSPIAHGRQGICRTCGLTNGLVAATKAKSAPAWAAFKSAVEAKGSIVLETEWLGSGGLHHVRCAEGHVSSLRPNDVQQGISTVCTTWPCFENDPIAVKKAFYAAIEEPGGTVVGEYVNSKTLVRVRCPEGHDWDARPGVVAAGHGCAECAGRSKAATRRAFFAVIEAADSEVIGEYVNSKTPVLVRCVNGHERPRNPGRAIRGAGCTACINRDPILAEENFRTALADAEATPLYKEWAGSINPHKIRCAEGHITSPRPNRVQQGSGVCEQCNQIHDVFYIVTGPAGLKLGVSSGNGELRLGTHRRDGYAYRDRLWTELPYRVADDTEDLVLTSLKVAGFKPVQGWEYFDIEVLPVVLGIVDRELAWYTPTIGPGQEEAATTGIESIKRIVAR